METRLSWSYQNHWCCGNDALSSGKNRGSVMSLPWTVGACFGLKGTANWRVQVASVAGAEASACVAWARAGANPTRRRTAARVRRREAIVLSVLVPWLQHGGCGVGVGLRRGRWCDAERGGCDFVGRA